MPVNSSSPTRAARTMVRSTTASLPQVEDPSDRGPPTGSTDHAVTIGAPPSAVWPWLTQLGWHRGGYYTPHWVDRLLFPNNRPSLDHLDPALVRNLAVGDVIPDGEPGTAWFTVATVAAPHILVLH